MKRLLMIWIVLSFLISLAGCSASQDAVSAVDAGAQAAPSTGWAETSPAVGELSVAMQLAFGTLMLDKTSFPIDSAQAAELLPLWKAARSLSSSDTTAEDEENGLLAQIQSTFTAEQLQAIQDLGLSSKNMPQIALELGLDFGGASSGARSAGAAAGTPGAARTQVGDPGMMGGEPPAGGGGMPGGGPPGMGSGFSGGSSSSPSQSISSGSGSFLGIPSPILEAIIAALKSKIQG